MLVNVNLLIGKMCLEVLQLSNDAVLLIFFKCKHTWRINVENILISFHIFCWKTYNFVQLNHSLCAQDFWWCIRFVLLLALCIFRLTRILYATFFHSTWVYLNAYLVRRFTACDFGTIMSNWTHGSSEQPTVRFLQDFYILTGMQTFLAYACLSESILAVNEPIKTLPKVFLPILSTSERILPLFKVNCFPELSHGVALFWITYVLTEILYILTWIRKTSHCACLHKAEQPIKKLGKKDKYFFYPFFTYFILGVVIRRGFAPVGRDRGLPH